MTKQDKDKLDAGLSGAQTPKPGVQLRQIREKLHITQEQLAKSLGYSRSVIANAEAGRGISRAFLHRYAEHCPEDATLILSLAPRPKEPLEENDVETMFFSRSSRKTDLDGTWFALWESTADREAVINTEELRVKARRNGVITIQNVEPSPENPKGGYLWIAESRLFDNQYLLGTYIAREPNVRSKGVLYMVIHPSGRFLNGQWIGSNYDGDWARGLVVVGRERSLLPEMLSRHRDQLPPLPYNIS